MIPLQRISLLVLLASLSIACGGSSDPRALVDAGNAELGKGDHKAALASFEDAQKALGANTADPLYHAAKLGAIDARVRIDAKAAAAEFEAYAKTAGAAVKDSDYTNIAGKLADANAFIEALGILKAGKAAHAGSAKIAKSEEVVLKTAKDRAAQGDSKLQQGLKGLGYL